MRTPLVALCIMATACTNTGSRPSGDTTPPPPPSTSTAPPTTVPRSSVCGNYAFVTAGPVSTVGDPTGDASVITSIRTESDESCDFLIVDLATASGAPATSVGPVEVEVLGSVLRLAFSEVDTSAVADTVLESLLVDRVFVVRSQTGSLFVDAHLSQPAEVSAEVEAEPARLTVRLRASGLEPAPPPVVGNNVVVVPPPADPVVYPLTIRGYARTFEANVIFRIRSEGDVVMEDFATAADWLDVWGAFSIVVPQGPLGEFELFVGEDSAQDGSEIGVRISLRAG